MRSINYAVCSKIESDSADARATARKNRVALKELQCLPVYLLLFCFVLAGCGAASTRVAPFRERPDSVAAGSLLGPFDGRIVDAATGDPVPGAVVYATWSFSYGLGLGGPAGFQEAVTNTDANGYYTIPKITKSKLSPGGPPADGDIRAEWRKSRTDVRLTGFQMVAYKKGYIGYRSDRRFKDFGTRLDFAQKTHLIQLERWRGELSHARHIQYMGGGTVINELLSDERQSASYELLGKRSGQAAIAGRSAKSTALVAAQLLSLQELQKYTGSKNNFDIGPLGDAPNNNFYSSQHFKAVGATEKFDLAIRLWTIGQQQARTQFDTLLGELPNANRNNRVADQSFIAEENDLFGLVFLDSVRGALVFITCGKSLCKSTTVIEEIALAAAKNIRAITPAVNLSTDGSTFKKPPPLQTKPREEKSTL